MKENVSTIELYESTKTALYFVQTSLCRADDTYDCVIKKLSAIYDKLVQDIRPNIRKANRLEPLVRGPNPDKYLKAQFDDIMGAILIDLNELFEELNR